MRGLAGAQTVDQRNAALGQRGEFGRAVHLHPLSIERVLQRCGVFFCQLLADVVVAPGARQHGGGGVFHTARLGHVEHVAGVAGQGGAGLGLLQLGGRDAELCRVGTVQVHFNLQGALQQAGKQPHGVQVGRLGGAHGKNFAVLDQVHIVLLEVMLELFLRQRAVRNTLHKGVVQAGAPQGLCGVKQAVAEQGGQGRISVADAGRGKREGKKMRHQAKAPLYPAVPWAPTLRRRQRCTALAACAPRFTVCAYRPARQNA